MDHIRPFLIRYAGIALLVPSLLSCTLSGLQADSSPPEIIRAVDCLAGSWDRRDMDAFGKCFASDADFVDVTGMWWQGREAIQRNHAFLFGAIDMTARGITLPVQTYGVLRNSTFAFTSTRVRSLRADVSIVHASWRITNDLRTPKPRIGLMTMMLAKDAGVWRIAALQSTEVSQPKQ